MSLPWGVLLLSCSWDLTRAFYDLFLYDTRNERLKTKTRLEAGVGSSHGFSLGAFPGFPGRKGRRPPRRPLLRSCCCKSWDYVERARNGAWLMAKA